MNVAKSGGKPLLVLLVCASVGCARASAEPGVIEDLATAPIEERTSALVDPLGALGEFVGGFENRLCGTWQSQRGIVSDLVREEVDEVLRRFDDTGRGLIDHFFDRLVRLLIGVAAFVSLLVLLLIAALRRRPAPGIPSEDER